MNKTVSFAVMALAMAFAPSTHAFPNEYATISGAICKIAGTNGGDANNKFAAKAIGGRNEGTANVFVICPLTLTPTPMEGGVITEITLSAYTIDGAARSLTCTAVIGSLARPLAPVYSSKTFTATVEGATQTWNAADFNGVAGSGIPGSAWTTITCLVPAQTGIAVVYAKLNPAM